MKYLKVGIGLLSGLVMYGCASREHDIGQFYNKLNKQQCVIETQRDQLQKKAELLETRLANIEKRRYLSEAMFWHSQLYRNENLEKAFPVVCDTQGNLLEDLLWYKQLKLNYKKKYLGEVKKVFSCARIKD